MRGLVPKFADNPFLKAYTKSIYIFMYCVYTVACMVENGEAVQV